MDLLFGTYWSLPGVRLLSSDDKVRSRFTQQGWAAHLTPSSACSLVAGALSKDRDRIRFSHLHALLVPPPPTGSVVERLEQQRRALPEGVRPNARGSAAEPRGRMFAKRFRALWGARHQRIRPREDMEPAEMRQKAGEGVGEKLFYVGGIWPRFGGRNPAPGHGP